MSRSEPRWLGRLAIDEAHFRQVRDHGGRHGLRDENALEASLARPRQRWVYDESASLPDLAASYGFGLIRNHPYVDGNKRVGLVAMVAFLDRNGYELIASDVEVVEVVLSVAAGDLAESALAAWVASRARPSDVRDVQGGQTITVTRNGLPVAELRPVPRRRFVRRTVIAEAARWAPRVDLARFRADLDAVVDPSVDG